MLTPNLHSIFEGSSSKSSLPEGERNILGIDILFREINLSIKGRPILQDVFGAAAQGDMLAVMGPSGSGKTSLLNGISGRLPLDSGEIFANGVKFTKPMRRQSCYVLQQDIFFSMLTLKETLTCTALLRLPDKMSWKEKKARINEIIDALDLRKCENTIIGDFSKRGLSGGEKKRANIACELLTNPALMLMDEPTSGLDSSTAHSLMMTMKKYTKNYNKTVITTIHQPSSQIFYAFDKVLLLSGGKVAYYGKGAEIARYFENIGLPCTPNYNPADFILDLVKSPDESVQETVTTAGRALTKTEFWAKELQQLGHGAKGWGEYRASMAVILETTDSNGHANEGFVMEENDAKTVNVNLEGNGGVPNGKVDPNSVEVQIAGQEMISNIDKYYDARVKFQSSFLTQFRVLFMRNFKQARHRVLAPISLVQSLLISLVVGLLWFQLDRTEEAIRDREGVLFFSSVYWSFVPLFDNLASYPTERVIINKERAAGSYRLSAFFLSKWLSELILLLIQPLGFLIIVYWTIGLKGVDGFFSMYGVMSLGVMLCMSIGLMIAVAANDMNTGITTGAVFMLATMLSGGFYTQRIPFWLDWIKYCSIVTYIFNSYTEFEYSNAPPITCATNTTSIFAECRELNVTSVPSEAYLAMRKATFPVWANCLCLVGYTIFFRLITYLLFRFVRCPSKN
ncbi:uncharacterized protein LOC135496813 isoform X2 [Lineus longissimus]|uniref:uncharacterized protein LOC135496813 isoform X2 n=1 Tax=Lineus longissimus TaxID=88925 RepID=UPI00315D60C7